MHTRSRIKEIIAKTIDSEDFYSGKIENVDYYNIFCRAAASESLYKYNGSNFCCFNYNYKKQNSIMIAFSIPVNKKDANNNNKHITERVMEVVKDVDFCLVKIDYIHCDNNKEDKMVYLIFIKVIEGE